MSLKLYLETNSEKYRLKWFGHCWQCYCYNVDVCHVTCLVSYYINKMQEHTVKSMLLVTFLVAITESASLHEQFRWQHRN